MLKRSNKKKANMQNKSCFKKNKFDLYQTMQIKRFI